MRPALHRAILRRLALRVGLVTGAVGLVALVGETMGASSLAPGAPWVVVAFTAAALSGGAMMRGRRPRARATVPRALSEA